MIQQTFTAAQVSVQPMPGGGGKLLIIQDADSKTAVVVPLDSLAAIDLGAKLSSGVAVAPGGMALGGG